MKQRLLILVCAAALLGVACTRKQSTNLTDNPAFATADSLIEAAIADTVIPGAVLCVVKDGEMIYNKAYGHRQVYPTFEDMTANTVFDLASLSKVVGTGMTAMTFVDEGLLDLDAPVNTYLPEFEGEATVRDVMTHVSGLPAYAQWKVLLADHPDATAFEKRLILMDHICHCPRHSEPRTKFVYSCLNFITMQYILETISGRPLDELAKARVFGPLGMDNTGYNPGPLELVAPTEIQPDSTCLRGVVHDPLARVMNSGVSGNAGVFAPSEDLAKLAVWMFRTLEGKKVKNAPFSRETLETMIAVPEGYEDFYRTLAWGVWEDFLPEDFETRLAPKSVYHTGYTGTFIVVDVEHRLAVILLTNRVHPHDTGACNPLRRSVTEAVAAALLNE